MNKHRLIIESIRDASARCLCERWSVTFPTFDSDSDQGIKSRLAHSFDLHIQAEKRGAA